MSVIFSDTMTKDKEQLILEHMNLAEAIAKKFHSKVPKCVTYDELISAGYLGLVASIKNYNFNRPFDKYASCFIYGSIVDYLRSLRWIDKRGKKEFDTKFYSIDKESKTNECNMLNMVKAYSFEYNYNSDMFTNIKSLLTRKEYGILYDYYVNEKSYRDIGKDHKVSKTRIGFLLSRAKKKIKEYLQNSYV